MDVSRSHGTRHGAGGWGGASKQQSARWPTYQSLYRPADTSSLVPPILWGDRPGHCLNSPLGSGLGVGASTLTTASSTHLSLSACLLPGWCEEDYPMYSRLYIYGVYLWCVFMVCIDLLINPRHQDGAGGSASRVGLLASCLAGTN